MKKKIAIQAVNDFTGKIIHSLYCKRKIDIDIHTSVVSKTADVFVYYDVLIKMVT